MQPQWLFICSVLSKVYFVFVTVSSDFFSNKDLNNLKYEDLVELFGPNVKSEFLEFIKEQESENYDSINSDRNMTKFSTTVATERFKNKNKEIAGAHEQDLTLYKDPWAVYDATETSETKHKLHEEGSNIEQKPIENDKTSTQQTDFSNFTLSTKNVSKTDSKSRLQDTKRIKSKIGDNVFDEHHPNESDLKGSNKNTSRMKIVYQLVEMEPMQPFSFQKILDFLKDIQKSFAFGSSRAIGDKIKYLKDFKDKILANMETRLNALWPSSHMENRRMKRDFMDSHGGHGMDFPSSEGALMTISFLTFAVFLIKLVLQVIHTIKSKHYSFNSFGTMTSASVSGTAPIKIIKRNRNARKLSMSLEDVETIEKTASSIEPSHKD